ncbi:D-alanine--D-alanine ligase family protein [Blautia sp. XA-2221]|uniref:D-alanine--D-alanine ligase family protein n=1 Tax=Blautia sp. XA-2221 TaxID=2903961 RepID=UPI0023789010|nr:D-alanine--D-alanine ligase [Blautia sp. XA-2221]
MKIVVLAGGTSTERDVSIVSGTGICNGLRAKGHQAVLVDVFCGVETVDWTDPFPQEYDVEAASAYIKSFNPHIEQLKKARKDFFGPNVLELCRKADFVFLGLHGANGEDGRIQAAFDLMGIKYTGTGYLSSAMAMDKGVTKWMFQMKGVPVPGGVTMKRQTRKEDLAELGLAFPVVVKTCCGGSSIGVYIVKDQEEYMKALDEAFAYEEEVVVEEFIQGTEYTVAVVDGKAYPVVQIVPCQGFYDYENKYKPGAVKETCPAPISQELTRRLQDYAVQGYRALGLESYARLDFIVTDDEKIYCLEANTLPGMTPTSLIPQEAAVLGMDYPTLCEELIRVSEKKYK